MNLPGADQLSAMLQSGVPGATVYLLGAGGCGMSALGHLFLDLGFHIAGSDLETNAAVRELQLRGARIHEGHYAEHIIEAKPAMVVVSTAIPSDNVEREAACRLNIPIVRRGTALACFLRLRIGVCVAGMHGKTTTAAMLACALRELTQDSSHYVGSLVPQLPSHGLLRGAPGLPIGSGQKGLFVAEADESDGGLREFVPDHSIILNLDHEHLDYFRGFEGVIREFREFAGRTKGVLMYCADDVNLPEVVVGRPNAVSYGLSSAADYRVEIGAETPDGNWHETTSGRRFEVFHKGGRLGEFTTRLRGEKNVSNAASVVAMLHRLGFSASRISSAVASFNGAARRQQELYSSADLRVFEDYGHHPEEIRATLSALRELAPRRVLAVFQPHRYSRTRRLLDQFASCFDQTDLVWITEIYPAGERPISGVNGEALVRSIQANGQRAEYVADRQNLAKRVRSSLQPGDLVVFMGAGNITRDAKAFVLQLKNEVISAGKDPGEILALRLSSESRVRRNEALAKRTTLRVGGTADCYIEPGSESDLAHVLRLCSETQTRVTVIGRGSNLLIQDGGIRGVVLCLARADLSRIEFRDGQLHCGAGARLKEVAAAAKRHGIGGLEFLEGIPGTVGGGLRMNAGAMGRSMFDVVRSVRFMDLSGAIRCRNVEDLDVRYRSCPLFQDHIALGAVLQGRPVPVETIEETMREFSRMRRGSQPAASSAGCIFKNPPGTSAGKLIEELGLKGMRVGGAVVSGVHGNFIVNEGKATARDVLRLIEIVKESAQTVRGIRLETEVEIIGEPLKDRVAGADSIPGVSHRMEGVEQHV